MSSESPPRLTAVFEPAPEGGFTCFFEEMPEVFSEGETVEEAEANLLDALNLVLEYQREQGRLKSSKGAVRHEIQSHLESRTLATNSLECFSHQDIPLQRVSAFVERRAISGGSCSG